jgi:hypothetical protein
MKYVSFEWVPPRTLTFAKRELSLIGQSADRSADIPVRDWRRKRGGSAGGGQECPPSCKAGGGQECPPSC